MTTIRTIHHLACSGGTVLTRCLTAMHGVYTLSEINPVAPRGIYFNPMDPLQQAVAQYQASLQFDFQDLGSAFLQRINPIVRKINAVGGTLLLRDHTHTDWIVPVQERGRSMLLAVLQNHYTLRPLLTLRNPVEAYASMREHGFDRSTKTFDDFCRRVRAMVNVFADYPIFHYEDFVADPDTTLKAMATYFEFSFNPDWREAAKSIILTGDSGRSSREKPIQPLPVREFSEDYRKEVLASQHYQALCEQFGYIWDPEELRIAREKLIETSPLQ